MCALATAIVDVAVAVLYLPAAAAAAAPLGSWADSAVPTAFAVALWGSVLAAAASATVVVTVTGLLKARANLETASDGSLLSLLPQSVRPSLGAPQPASMVMHNGVLVPRTAGAAATALPVGEGRRLGSA
jgi:hypothetical protein